MPPPTKATEGLSVREAAQRIGVSENTIRNWVDSKKLPATRIGLGPKPRIRIAEEDIDAAVN